MQSKIYTVGIYTLGCKVNQYESEAIAEGLIKCGLEIHDTSAPCDIYIINTCTVTAESDRKARQFIRRAISKNPSAYIIVCGCMAQVAANKIAEISGVDFIFGNTDKLAVISAVLSLIEQGCKNASPQISVKSLEDAKFEKMSIESFARTRAYVKIEDGCESRCTYCIIPSARGNIRSKPEDEVIAEVTKLTENGCREVVLTGIETASYGRDLGNTDLASLICKIDRIPNIGRVRLGSLDPSLITPAFVDKIASVHSLAPHLHLSLQSGSSRVLALMKRKYNADMAMRAIELLREKIPNVKLTTDVIVGFPDESEEDFKETVNFAKRARFLMMHIFPYSPRAGTVAASMKNQIPLDIKKQRAAYLACVANKIREEVLQYAVAKQTPVSVLFETYQNGICIGHTPDFIEVAVKHPTSLHGETHNVFLKSTDGSLCFGLIDTRKSNL